MNENESILKLVEDIKGTFHTINPDGTPDEATEFLSKVCAGILSGAFAYHLVSNGPKDAQEWFMRFINQFTKGAKETANATGIDLDIGVTSIFKEADDSDSKWR